MRTFSIAIETENLGMAGLEDFESCLRSLEQQTFPISRAVEVVVISGGHLTEEKKQYLIKKYPWITLCQVDGGIDYTRAKELCVTYTTGDIIVFADADVVYTPVWLETLLHVFEEFPDADMAAGYTRIKPGKSFWKKIYACALNMSWMFIIEPVPTYSRKTRFFSFNNIAVLRGLVQRFPFVHNTTVYRGGVSQWVKKLLVNNVVIYQTTTAYGYHSAPSNIGDWWYRMLILAADPVVLADFYYDTNGDVHEKRNVLRRVYFYIRWIVFKVYLIAKNFKVLFLENPSLIGFLVLAMPVCMVHWLLFCIGGAVSVFNRRAIYRRITAREYIHVV